MPKEESTELKFLCIIGDKNQEKFPRNKPIDIEISVLHKEQEVVAKEKLTFVFIVDGDGAHCKPLTVTVPKGQSTASAKGSITFSKGGEININTKGFQNRHWISDENFSVEVE